MSASDTIALATSLATRGLAATVLPPTVARALEAMRQDLAVLLTQAEARLPDSGPNDAKEVANRILGAAWGGLRWWTRGWALLPYPEHAVQADAARVIEGQIFADGLRFTTLTFRAQWVESQARLGLIDKEGLAALITTLGGATILEVVRRAHDDFGRALGITEVSDDTDSATLVRPGMDQLMSSMRRYILQVTAHADSGEPESAALADTLLMPIKTWKSRPTSPSAGDDAPEPAPVPVPAPPAVDPPSAPAE
jgi:hypothetical protein